MVTNNINIIKRALFCILLSIIMVNAQAQTGLNFQGVARSSNNVILASQAITIKLSILQGSSTGKAEYIETRKVTTNAQGLFTAVIGDTGAISTLGNFTTINWKLSPKFLKIEMDAGAGTNFITMGTTQFQYVAYAQFAKSVDAENIAGIVPVSLGGTGVNSLTGLKTALALNNVNNTTDLTKPISTLTQTALDLKLNTTANAASATIAGNITATTNTTLTSLVNLATVGTITNGVWSGKEVAVEKGGTGLTSAGTNGQVLTSTGSGTLTWTTLSSEAGGRHTIGELYGGGKVFYITTDGLHGLIAETQDQSSSCSWYYAQDVISASDNHSTAGKLYTDWRLPTKNELNLLYLQKTVVGGFANSGYWSSIVNSTADSYVEYQNFENGSQPNDLKGSYKYVRAIRSF